MRFGATTTARRPLLASIPAFCTLLLGVVMSLLLIVPATAQSTPQITFISPPSGPQAGGTLVTIYGQNLAGITSVFIGGIAVAPAIVADDRVRFTTPAHAAGPVDIAVTDGDGVFTAPNAFTYSGGPPAPRVTSVRVPASGTYSTGAGLSFMVNFDQAVTVDTAGGHPYLTISVGDSTRYATITASAVPEILVFRLDILEGDYDNNGIVLSNTISGGIISGQDSGIPANRQLNAVQSTAGILVNALPRPSVVSIVPTSLADPNANSVNMAVTFDRPVMNVSVDDFTLVATGSAQGTISYVVLSSGDGGYLVYINNISGVGTLTLRLNPGTDIVDDAGNGPPTAFAGTPHTVNAPTVPGAPTITDVVAGSRQVSVYFTAPTDDGGSPIGIYTATSLPGMVSATGSGSPIRVPGLTDGTDYTFTVTARNSVGEGAPSAASDTVSPKSYQFINFPNPGTHYFGTTPTLTATASSGLAVTFSSISPAVCSTTPEGQLSFVSAGTCSIQARQAGNNGFYEAPPRSLSFAVYALPPTEVRNAVATAGDGIATINFDPPDSLGGSSLNSYVVQSDPGNLSGMGNASPIQVPGLTNGVDYTFRVRAVNNAQLSSPDVITNTVTPIASQAITFADPGTQNFGTSPTLTASSDSGLPVTFTSSTTGVCTITTSGTLTFQSIGNCTINADQSGSGAYLPAPQVSRTFNVAPTETTTAVALSPANATFGQTVTVTATVSAAAPGTGVFAGQEVLIDLPDGTIEFPKLDAAGVATTTFVAGQGGRVTAVYAGGSGYLDSNGFADLTVSDAATTTAIALSPEIPTFGETVTVTVTVSAVAPGTGVPAGQDVSILLPNGLTEIATLDASGVATTSFVAQRPYTVTAVYGGGNGFAGSDSNASYSLNPAYTTTTVRLSPPDATLGETITATVAVSVEAPGTGVPAGEVSFALPGGSTETATLDSSGIATTTFVAAQAGQVTASYKTYGVSFFPSSGFAYLTVGDATTATAVSLSPANATFGETVTVKATVSVDASGTGVPAGDVSFALPDGSTETATLDASGVATTTFVAGQAGQVTATYAGAAGFTGSDGFANLAVGDAATTTVVSLSPSNATFGQTVTVTLTVGAVAPGTGFPAGDDVVIALPGGSPQTATLDAAGVAITTFVAGQAGQVTATYAGGTGFTGSNGFADLTVGDAATTTTVALSSATATFGQTVTATVTVSVDAPGTGVPVGEVSFALPDGSTETATLDPSGVATTTFAAGAAGPVTATYAGGTGFTGSDGSADLTVGAAATTTAVSLSPANATFGETVTVTASVGAVAPGTGVPAGDDVVIALPDGTTETATLDASGVAITTFVAGQAGQVTATYAGGTGFTGSDGFANLAVGDAATTTAVSLSPANATFGETVTVTATVSAVAPGTGVPAGQEVSIAFPDGSTQTATLDAAGVATATFTADTAGQVTVTYAGGTGFTGSDGFADLTVTATDATLAALSPSIGSLQPGFASSITAYEIDLAFESETISFTPVANGAVSSITVNGQTVNSGDASTPISLAIGYTPVSIVVTAADGSTSRNYVVTVSRAVVLRPDPSVDAEVIGLVNAQASTAARFAQDQITNFARRLEQLHNEGDRRASSMDLRVSMARRQGDGIASELDRQAYDDVGLNGSALGYAADRASSPSAAAHTPADSDRTAAPAFQQPDLGPFAVWTGGFVNFGESDNGGVDFDYTMVGVSGGIDYRFSDRFVGGFGFGYGRDKTEIGANGTESRATAFSGALYGSFKPMENVFIDGLVGASTLDFQSLRFVTVTGDYAAGQRSGSQIFAALTAGYEHQDDNWLISPYGRIEASRSWLDGFTEQGGGLFGLTYGDHQINTVSGVLGLRANYRFETEMGIVRPGVRAEYTHDFAGSSRATVIYSDLDSPPFGIETEPNIRDHLSVGLSLDWQISNDVNLGFDYQTSFGGSDRDHRFGTKLGVRF